MPSVYFIFDILYAFVVTPDLVLFSSYNFSLSIENIHVQSAYLVRLTEQHQFFVVIISPFHVYLRIIALLKTIQPTRFANYSSLLASKNFQLFFKPLRVSPPFVETAINSPRFNFQRSISSKDSAVLWNTTFSHSSLFSSFNLFNVPRDIWHSQCPTI